MRKIYLILAIFLVAPLGVHSVSANEIKYYYTNVFNGMDSYRQCENARENIEKVFSDHEKTGVSIIQSVCEKLDEREGQDQYRVSVLYSSSIYFKIENYISYYKTLEMCLDAQAQFQKNASLLSILHNHCSGSQSRYVFRVDYVDNKKLDMVKYTVSETFLENSKCLAYLPQLVSSFEKNGYKVIVSQCIEGLLGVGNQSVYRNHILYLRDIDKYFLTTLEGESFSESAPCLAKLPHVKASLEGAGFPVINGFCEKLGMRWNQRVTYKEDVYLKPLKSISSNDKYEDKTQCDLELNHFLKQLEKSSNFQIIYPFCQLTYTKWSYKVFYKNKK